MNLVLSKEQKYISKVDHLSQQAWQMEDIYNTGNMFVTNVETPFLPDTFAFNLYIQDVIGDSKYSEYRLETTVVYETSFKDWLIIPLENLNIPIYSNKVKINFAATYNYLNVVEGFHTAKVVYKIFGKKDSLETEITSYSYPFSFKIFPTNHFLKPLSLQIVNSSTTKDRQSLMVSGDFEVIAPPGVKLWYKGVSYSSYKGSNLHIFEVEVDDVDQTSVTKLITVKYTTTTYTILVNSFLYTDYTPKIMVFSASAGVIDKPIQKVYFEEKGDFTLEYPQWLEVKKMNYSPRHLEVFLPSTDNFGSGEFNQPIIMQFSDRRITIPVILNIFDGFNLGLKSGEIMFAESTPLLELFTNSTSNHLEIDVILDDIDTNLFNFSYKIPFFQKKAEFSISEILRRQVILKDYFKSNYTKSELPILSLVIREMQGETMLKEYFKTNIPVLNGAIPSKIFDKTAILNMDIVERFTPYGTAVVNILSPGMFSYSIRVNSEVVEHIEKVVGVIRSIYLEFRKLGVTEGDMVEFVLHTSKGDITKAFVITQLTPHSNIFYYRNKHGLTSSIELTGELKIDVEKKRKLEKFSSNGEFKVRSYLEDSQEKISINTGYIFLDQIALVNELLESNEAFFYQGDDRFMIIPTSEKITKLDTNSFLNSVQLEFIINDIHYAQVYFQQ